MGATVRTAVIGAVVLCAALNAGCFPFAALLSWGSNDIPLRASTEELRFDPGVSVGTFTVFETRDDLSRCAVTSSFLVTEGAPASLIGPVKPSEFTTHGLDPQTVTVHVDRTGVAAGTYQGWVMVSTAPDEDPEGGVAAQVIVVVSGG